MFEFIGVAGSGELQNSDTNRVTLNMGITVKDLYDKVSASYNHSQTGLIGVGISYPAVPVDFPNLATSYPVDYANSVQMGVSALRTELESAAALCPAEQFIIAGYSQGAQVVNEALSGVSREIVGRVRSKILFGDPLYNHNNVPENQGRDGIANVTDGILSWMTGPGPVDPADVQSRSRSYCDWRDIICQGLTALAASPQIPPYYWHTQYRTWATQAAADFIRRIEPPAACRVSAATWSRGKGVTSSTRGVEIVNPVFGEVKVQSGYRFVGFVAVANEFTSSQEIVARRWDQPSYRTSDDPIGEQSVATADGHIDYFQARVVPANCGQRNGALTFLITTAQDRHVDLSGTLTFGSAPYQGALVLWQWARTGEAAVPTAALIDFDRRTLADGSWRLNIAGPVKPVISVGVYTMRLAFPGDVNHREVVSPSRTVTVTSVS